MPRTKQEAEAELEELDVREVSLVDRPANKKKFLIIKRARQKTLEDEEMEFSEILKGDSDASLLELLGLSDGTVEDTQDSDEIDITFDDTLDFDVITKGNVQELAKAVSLLVGRLAKAVNSLKSQKAEPGSQLVRELQTIAQAIVSVIERLGDSGPEKSDTEKADGPGLLKAASSALQSMMQVAAKLKELGGADSVPSAIIAKLKSAAESLLKAIGTGSSGGKDKKPAGQQQEDDAGSSDSEDDSEKRKTKKRDDKLQIFVCNKEEENPEIIIKAGAKMRKARLNQFEKAVETLMSLLKELKGDQEDEGKKRKSVSKNSSMDLNEALSKGFEVLESRLGEKMDDAIKGLKGQVEEVAKRVEEVETGVAPGKGDADVTEVEKDTVKKQEGFWSNLFR